MANFSNDAVELDTVEMTGPVVLGHVTSLDHTPNTDVQAPESGDPFPESQAIMRQDPESTFSTESIMSLLEEVGLSGLLITSDGTHDGFVSFAQKHDQGGTHGRASSGHLSKTIGDGHLFIESINGSRNGNVVASCRVVGVSSDGATNPVAVSASATLPSSPVEELFSIGKPTILGTLVSNVESVNVTYAPQYEASNDADTIWPTDLDPQHFPIVIEIVARSPELYNTTPFPQEGAHTDSDTVIRYVQRALTASQLAAASNGGFVQFDTDAHILGQVTGLVTVSQDYSAAGRAVGRITARIACYFGAAAPIVWSTDVHYDTTEVTPQTT